MEIDMDKISQDTDFWWDSPGQLIEREIKTVEFGEVTDLRWDGIKEFVQAEVNTFKIREGQE
ncbi:hypothetical protein Pyn_24544 [Prunus yedoensis var. nudiflora]|uniref:Uncharacterized protein n=1 Tax=Prunus yedoensis var. nudiflora TaxID=2094558 RepID=A0A314UUF9_PRUYE|nr:hypothetical protein Pyn_24544 [Prunus yedoensis var. nudiflora]